MEIKLKQTDNPPGCLRIGDILRNTDDPIGVLRVYDGTQWIQTTFSDLFPAQTITNVCFEEGLDDIRVGGRGAGGV